MIRHTIQKFCLLSYRQARNLVNGRLYQKYLKPSKTRLSNMFDTPFFGASHLIVCNIQRPHELIAIACPNDHLDPMHRAGA